MKHHIFISSVQKEFSTERRALKDYIEGEPLLRRFFEVFLFEDIPAADRRADDVYLEQVDHAAVYVGLFGNDYGREDAERISPTEREFDRATAKGKTRLIFVKGTEDAKRHPKMQALIRKAGDQLIRRRFTGVPDLTAGLYASLIENLEQIGALHTGPFDSAPCLRATLDDISPEKVRKFLRTARYERQYPLAEDTPVETALTHLDLLDRGRPTHAAILLFGKEPQRFLITSKVKCLRFHGTEIRKPIPSYQTYKGTVFEMVDQAVDFVLSKIDRAIGTREYSIQAPETYELPVLAVKEAIVNAVAHRDYTSNASVQVMLFADRLEVWNPGHLPPTLTMARLRQPHASIPHNPLIADPLYLVRYVEQAGTGIIDAIGLCRKAGLPEPEFRQDGGQFVMTLWRGWLTDKMLDELKLNERQRKAVVYLQSANHVTNREYRTITGASERTALRELKQLSDRGILEKIGETGRAASYSFVRLKPVKNPPNPPFINPPGTRQTRQLRRRKKGAIKRTKRTRTETRRKSKRQSR
jgi:ATP-dependent DNA helicase RecG